MINDRTIERIKKFEGYRRKPYKDTRGHLTAGFGHNLDANPLEGWMMDEMCKRMKWNSSREAEEFWTIVLEDDVQWLEAELETNFPFYTVLPSNVKTVYVDLLFNMGMRTLNQFNRMHMFVDEEDWDTAAAELLYSRYLFDTKRRAVENAKLMANDFNKAMEILGKLSDDHYREASKYA